MMMKSIKDVTLKMMSNLNKSGTKRIHRLGLVCNFDFSVSRNPACSDPSPLPCSPLLHSAAQHRMRQP